jgi:hypothetical protein
MVGQVYCRLGKRHLGYSPSLGGLKLRLRAWRLPGSPRRGGGNACDKATIGWPAEPQLSESEKRRGWLAEP